MLFTLRYRCLNEAAQILFSVQFDGDLIAETSLDGQEHLCCYQIDDNRDSTVQIQMRLQGKTHEHTVLDHANQIISDCAVVVDAIEFDRIDVTNVFCQGLPCYEHDTNGTSQRFTDEFYGYMGCNGIATLEFSLPVYKWFLTKCH